VLAINDLILKEKWEELIYLHINLEKIIAEKGLKSPEVIEAKHILDIKINEYCQIKK
jgi:hypothetical protein